MTSPEHRVRRRRSEIDEVDSGGHHIADLTRLPKDSAASPQGGGTNIYTTNSYINDAFDFLQGDTYSPYKPYAGARDTMETPTGTADGSVGVPLHHRRRGSVDGYEPASTAPSTHEREILNATPTSGSSQPYPAIARVHPQHASPYANGQRQQDPKSRRDGAWNQNGGGHINDGFVHEYSSGQQSTVWNDPGGNPVNTGYIGAGGLGPGPPSPLSGQGQIYPYPPPAHPHRSSVYVVPDGGDGGGGESGGNATAATPVARTRRRQSSPPSSGKGKQLDAGHSKKKRTIIAVVLVILFFIIAGLVAVIVLFMLGYFDEKPADKPVVAEFEGYARFNAAWTEDLADKNSERYLHESSQFLEQLSLILDSNYEDEYVAELVDIRSGSIDFFFKLAFSVLTTVQDVTNVLEEGYRALTNAGELEHPLEEIVLQAVTTTTLIYTTRQRTTPAPVLACEPVTEILCLPFNYTNTAQGYPGNAAIARRFDAMVTLSEYGCYDHTLQFACAAYYPECRGGRLKFPCRSFCEAVQSNCRFTLVCDSFYDDDDPGICVPLPDAPVATTMSPAIGPCVAENQYQCGDGSCIPLSQKCDNAQHCPDGGDELYCGQISPLDCDFENGDFCDYRQVAQDHSDWEAHTGHTPSSGTGPDTDHTTRTALGHYVLAEGSGGYSLDETRLGSPTIQLQRDHCLRFYFHMYGDHIGALQVLNQNDKDIWFRSHDQGNEWKLGYVTLTTSITKVTFKAIRGDGYLSDIALDDVTMREGACPDPACPEGEFQCENGNCVLQKFVCNGQNECGDFSEEKQCECNSEEFQCGLGMCIPAYQRCNGETNCPDNTDEQSCGNCTMGRHKCDDGTCIMSEWVCDHEADCPDRSDETDCGVCPAGQSACRDYGCVADNQVCDGVVHCVDGSDEFGCVRQQPAPSLIVEFQKEAEWRPLCAENFVADSADEICQLLGYPSATRFANTDMSSTSYVRFKATETEGQGRSPLLADLEIVPECPNFDVIELECLMPECGRPSRDDHIEEFIINGQEAHAGQWPWQIALYVKGSFICGGSLVSRRHVITAAHCVRIAGFATNDFSVMLGSLYRSLGTSDSERVVASVLRIQTPGDYQAFHLGSDIAILTLSQDVPFTDTISPICFPNSVDYFSTSSQCYVSGWGFTNFTAEETPAVLQEAKMKLWSHSKCESVHAGVDDRQLCAGYNSGYIANCPGDSGGPLVCRDPHGTWKLVGVFSFIARGCNVPMAPPVFTDVNHYLPWITEGIDCAFVCDNEKCLWDDTATCDGIDQCGDFSDETRLCSSSLACDFETDFQCGYTYSAKPSYTTWSRRQHPVAANMGPVVDHTFGNTTGHFMFAGPYSSMLLSPIHESNGPLCLRYHYHLRGPQGTVGSLTVFRVTAGPGINHPSEVDPSTGEEKAFVTGYQLDIWYYRDVDIQAGRFVIGFETFTTTNSYPMVAIDDVIVMEGTCQSQQCSTEQFTCQDGTCIDNAEICNFHVGCVQEEDEEGCQDGLYLCDFERYGDCRLEQEIADDYDWDILTTGPSIGNAPSGDHTTGTYGGRVLYLDTLYMAVGDQAIISMPIKVHKADTCFSMHYNTQSRGVLKVLACSRGPCVVIWQTQSGETGGDWIQIQLPLGVAVDQIKILVINGGQVADDVVGYVTVDDVSIKEETCPQPECQPLTEYRCASGQCISRSFWCDGFDDCDDQTDEGPENCPCFPDSFVCAGDGSCLQSIVRCDGYDNCIDGSDELRCNGTCGEDEFACPDGLCQPIYHWCDGFSECHDGYDEPQGGCDCFAEQHQCADGICIPGYKFCDGNFDCADNSDEYQGCECNPDWHFACGNGQCIPTQWRCDGVAQCTDGSDETVCGCDDSAGEFACFEGTCLAASDFCNGIPNCIGGEDEPADCRCGLGRSECFSGGCIASQNLCDGSYNCFDHSDESGCHCGPGTFRCSSGRCISQNDVCDLHLDCDDMSDETDCTCTVDQYRCTNGRCILKLDKCDGQDHCGDGSDEVNCTMCQPGQYQCPDRKCIEFLWVCDGQPDCADGSDELECGSCTADEIYCDNYDCVARNKICDGVFDCNDGKDELGCVRLRTYRSGEKVVEATWYGDNDWYPVCANDWQVSWSDDVCRSLGMGPAMTTSSTISLEVAGYLKVKANEIGVQEFSVARVQFSETCANSTVLKITCEQLTCGLQSDTFLLQPTPMIIGGDLAAEREWPWMGNVAYLGSHLFRCGAILIDRQWALSAAHCFFWSNGNSLVPLTHYFKVSFGSTALRPQAGSAGSPSASRQEVGVSRILLHEGYAIKPDNNRLNDIALIQLDEAVDVTDDVRTLCLPDKSETPAPTSRCYTAGWGVLNTETDEVAYDLRDAKLKLWADADCVTSVWESFNSSQQLCAGYSSGHVSTCSGDSGGPLMCQNLHNRWILTGITSVGPANCGQGLSEVNTALPGVFTRVGAYIEWIHQQIGLFSKK